MAGQQGKLVGLAAVIDEVFSSSSDSSEEEFEENLLVHILKSTGVAIPKIQNYVEEIVPQYEPSTFKEHFRLNKATFEYLLSKIAVHLCSNNLEKSGRPAVAPHKQLLLALWYFATPDSYRSILDRFNVGKGTAVRIVRRVTSALFSLAPEVIIWPSGNKINEVTAGFQQTNGFPNVIGAVDGSHIPIPAPKVHAQSYYNRKGFHSIILQAVCDHEGRLTHCYAGEPGSVHDARVFRRSELQTYIDNESNTKFPAQTHIVGDPAYPCLPQVMVPFKENGHLSLRQKNFNFCLSSTRCIIERTFALLKGRLRCLKYLDMSDINEIPKVIIACCVLHNICMSQGDDASDYEETSLEEHNDDYNNTPRGSEDVHNRSGKVKRNEIAEILPIKITH